MNGPRRRMPPEVGPMPPGATSLRREGRRGLEFYTAALGEPPSIRGERLLLETGRIFRHWEPTRSKLGAALVLGWTGPLPRAGERWLYLGAASGTTASHVADLVGKAGAVYAVEPSVRPFLGLLRTADRYPNLLPIFGDARRPDSFGGSVPLVDGIYADVAQADQPEILAANIQAFLRPGGSALLALKTASMGRDPRPRDLLRRAIGRLPDELRVEVELPLDPFHKRHFLVGGRWGKGPASGTAEPPRVPRITPRSGHLGRRPR